MSNNFNFFNEKENILQDLPCVHGFCGSLFGDCQPINGLKLGLCIISVTIGEEESLSMLNCRYSGSLYRSHDDVKFCEFTKE